MAVEFQPYGPGQIEAVRAFNQRLGRGGCAMRFPERPESSWLPQAPGETIFEQYFLAIDGAEARGGYIHKHQPFLLLGEETQMGCIYLPISEGVVDSRYNQVGLQLLAHALRRQPLAYSLGMGGLDQPYPKLLKAAGWKLVFVPFYFYVVNPASFQRNITHLRRRPAFKIALDVLAATGLGHAGVKLLNAVGNRRFLQPADISNDVVEDFGPWVDQIWTAGRHQYSLTALRDLACLRRLYPREKNKYLKLKVTANGRPVGWAVLLDTQLANHKQFGNLRLGSIIDGFSDPGCEILVAGAAKRLLIGRGVDLIVTNQSHAAWRAAFARTGHWSARSNFIFAASPQLARKLLPSDRTMQRIHFNRGDGEGPSHL